MSDEQGDAEFEASLAGIPQGSGPAGGAPAGAGASSADAQTVRELRAAIEELARRMGAGFREDLAQIRAIATAVAERDFTDDVHALRTAVADLAARDVTTPVLDELSGVRASLERLASAAASGDDVAGVRAELVPVQAALDRIASRLDDDSGRSQVLSGFQALETKLDEQSQQLGRLAGDLRAHLADALGDLDGDAVLGELAGLRRQLGTDRGTVVEQLQDHLADVASGEVVGALWDEVRALRDVLDATASAVTAIEVPAPAAPEPAAGGLEVDEVLESIAALRSEVEGIGAAVAAATEPTADPAVAGLRDDVRQVLDQLHGLSDAVSALEEAAAAPAGPDTAGQDEEGAGAPTDPALIELTEELATLRAELAEGLVVEPSDALSASLDALRVEVDSLRSSLADVPAAAPAPEPAPAGPSADLVATLLDELATVRAGVDEVRDQLEERLATEAAPEAASPAQQVEVELIADQIASLRDLVASEVDGLRQSVVAAADRAAQAAETASERVEAVTERVASTPEPVAAPAGEVQARLDADTLELLRDEIRTAGAVGDEVLDAVRQELKALRRRIAVKASERVLDDQQLAQIADAVAERLGQG